MHFEAFLGLYWYTAGVTIIHKFHAPFLHLHGSSETRTKFFIILTNPVVFVHSNLSIERASSGQYGELEELSVIEHVKELSLK